MVCHIRHPLISRHILTLIVASAGVIMTLVSVGSIWVAIVHVFPRRLAWLI